jgi:hypothetical protein
MLLLLSFKRCVGKEVTSQAAIGACIAASAKCRNPLILLAQLQRNNSPQFRRAGKVFRGRSMIHGIECPVVPWRNNARKKAKPGARVSPGFAVALVISDQRL